MIVKVTIEAGGQRFFAEGDISSGKGGNLPFYNHDLRSKMYPITQDAYNQLRLALANGELGEARDGLFTEREKLKKYS